MTSRPTTVPRQFQHGDLRLEYALIYSARKTIGLHIYPDGRVIVRAPRGCAQVVIDGVLVKRAAWLKQHLTRIRRAPAPPAPRRYVADETFGLLGESLRLVIRPAKRARVHAVAGELIVETDDPDRAEGLIEDWYKRQAAQIFSRRLTVCFERVRPWGAAYPTLRVRRMKTRWGSCTGRGAITLNSRLVELPVDLIDYVILHELCHLREMNHGPRFYALLAAICPEWQAQRARMKRIAI